jgi:outer membrane protein assembly factor BamB
MQFIPNARFSHAPRVVRTRSRNLAGPCLAMFLAPWLATTAEWPHWRGPNFDGSSTARNLPATFSQTENVRWSVPLPGAAASTPIVAGKSVFLSSTDKRTQELLAIGLDAETGAVLWQRSIAPGIGRDNRSNYSAPSPVTDGRHVWFYYSTGELIAMDLEGTEVWRRNLQRDYGEFAFLWTYSSSPLLFDGRLYLQVLQRDVPVSGRGRADGPNDSYLLALDPSTGKELWRQIRPSDARGESREAFSTPIPLLGTERPEILVAGGDAISGHHPATGRELWRWGTWNPNRITHWRLVPSPAAGAGVILAAAPKDGPIIAVKTGRSGVLGEDDLAWTSDGRELTTDVATPLFYQGRFYVLDGNRKSLTCVEPATGKILWTGEFESRAIFEASPTGADGRIYCVNHRGQVFVAAAGDAFELLHQTDMGDASDRMVRSSIVAVGERLLIRTDSRLTCVAYPDTR